MNSHRRCFPQTSSPVLLAPAGDGDAASGPGDEFDYVVIGSGAGGAPLAANLAEAGYRVLVLEAGSDAENEHYRVPAFHPLASEDPAYSWDFFVRHYSSDEQVARDNKIQKSGIFYPRAATLGGCTAHNAMITILPHDSDWDHIAEITGDASWRASQMRGYFKRLERCTYLDRPAQGGDSGGHGFDGWLTTSRLEDQVPWVTALLDGQLRKIAASAAEVALAQSVGNPFDLIHSFFDPNDDEFRGQDAEGLFLVPVAIDKGRRNGARERLLDVKSRHPDKLKILTDALATRVVLETVGDSKRATGVEYLQGAHLYAADPASAGATPGEKRFVRARREVILAGGAFNSPQLLKLSGIGPADELNDRGIEVHVNLPGVGENLQDRYEVTVVNELEKPISLLEEATFTGDASDPAFVEWQNGEKGIYSTNGVVLGIIKRSDPAVPDPDIIIFGLPGSFEGYVPGYSGNLRTHKNFFTWAILKAHTSNAIGTVKLRSKDPRDTPDINFKYFDDGAGGNADLDAVVKGVEFARAIMSRRNDIVTGETAPGNVDVKEYVRNNAWGHHASCTNRMGASGDRMAVVDSKFRVFGTTGLRVVDASVFPRIPGFFIVTPVYMISEKASDVIIADARANPVSGAAASTA